MSVNKTIKALRDERAGLYAEIRRLQALEVGRVNNIDKEKLKTLADRVLTERRFCTDEHHRELAAGIQHLLAEIDSLRGLRPEWPPRPPDGQGLPRYGLRWNGPQEPLAVPMADGYWTPWHLAERVREDRDGLLEAGAHLL